MKKLFVIIGISLGVLIIGAVTFSISKAKKWAKHFDMTYFEFAYMLAKAIRLLQEGVSLEDILTQTGIDFTYEDIKRYFLDSYYYLNQNIDRFDFLKNDEDEDNYNNIIRPFD
jgi:hypothetical protein